MKKLNSTVATFPETIFSTMSQLARKSGAINLGQGFPDFNGPDWLIKLYQESFEKDGVTRNQYAPAIGVQSLRRELSHLYSSHYKLNYDPDLEVTVTTGCTEAIFCAIACTINPGDEVILFEPFYDSYEAAVRMAGGVPVFVTLMYPTFNYDSDELESAFSDKTKLIIVNTPHNPTGKVFDKSELMEISALCVQYDVYAISDEVYEHLIFGDAVHLPLASFDGMKERTFTLSSLGKTFGVTGWKIGWAMAPRELTKSLRLVKQYTTFCTNHPLQQATTLGLQKISEYLPSFQREYLIKRNLFIEGLDKTSLTYKAPRGTYFVIAKIPSGFHDDIQFCLKMIEEAKVAAIPPSAFYRKSSEGSGLVRFCFAKKSDTLIESLKRLQQWIPS